MHFLISFSIITLLFFTDRNSVAQQSSEPFSNASILNTSITLSLKNVPIIHILTVAKLSYLNKYNDCAINNETHFFKHLKYLQDMRMFYVARHPLHVQPSIHAQVSKHLFKIEKLSHINLFNLLIVFHD